MLRWRLISAAIIISFLVALLWVDYQEAIFGVPGIWLFPVLIVAVLLATEEVLSLVRATGYAPAAWPVYLGNVFISVVACGPMWFRMTGKTFPADNPLGQFGWPLLALTLAVSVAFAAEVQRYRAPGKSIISMALGCLALVYVGLLSSFLPMLRLHQLPHGNGWGLAALVSLLWVVKMADTGAYAVGRAIGRTKMTPLVSPGKTWEGAAGGLAFASAASWAFFHWIAPLIVGARYIEPPLAMTIGYGLTLAVAGMIGDLAESLLKRDVGRKDSSAWLPGLGGVLDIVDSVLVAAPVAYLWWVFGFMGPIS